MTKTTGVIQLRWYVERCRQQIPLMEHKIKVKTNNVQCSSIQQKTLHTLDNNKYCHIMVTHSNHIYNYFEMWLTEMMNRPVSLYPYTLGNINKIATGFQHAVCPPWSLINDRWHGMFNPLANGTICVTIFQTYHMILSTPKVPKLSYHMILWTPKVPKLRLCTCLAPRCHILERYWIQRLARLRVTHYCCFPLTEKERDLLEGYESESKMRLSQSGHPWRHPWCGV